MHIHAAKGLCDKIYTKMHFNCHTAAYDKDHIIRFAKVPTFINLALPQNS